MRKWAPLIAICLGTFMLLVDVTIVNVALPSMARSLHTSFSSLQWVVDGYALALAALLLGVGSIADLSGHRRSYLAGLLLFALASLTCGLSPNAGVLIGARIVQGVGGAAMFATTAALLNSSYRGKDRGIAWGWWGAVAGAAAAVGPVLGGVLVQAISWRWIFFVHLPVSAVAIAMTLRSLSNDAGDRSRRIDLAGMATFTAAAGSLTYALIRANEHGWAQPATYVLSAVSAVSLVAFVVVEARSEHAMLDLSLFHRRQFVGTIVAALVLNFAAFAALTYSSIWLQTVRGLSPVETGLTSLPLALTAFVVSAVGGRFVHNRPGLAIGGGMALVAAGSLLVAAFVDQGSSWPALLPGMFVVGLGVGLGIPVLNSSAMSAVPVQRGGMASGAVNTARQLGYAIGIAVLGSVFASRANASLHRLVGASALAHGLAGGQAPRILATAGSARAALDASFHRAAISGIDGAFLVAGLAGVVAAAVVFALMGTAATPEPEAWHAPATTPTEATPESPVPA